MIRRPPRSTRTDTLFPYTTLFRSNRSNPCPRVECGNARSAGPDSLGKRPLWIEFQLKLPVEAAPLEQRIVANVGAHHFPNLSIREKSPKSKPGRAAIIRDRSEERRVGKECVSTCRFQLSPVH